MALVLHYIPYFVVVRATIRLVELALASVFMFEYALVTC